MQGLKISEAKKKDAKEILNLLKEAFQTEGDLYNYYDFPPLSQSLEDLKKEFDEYLILKGEYEGRIIASVRAKMTDDITAYIGRLAVRKEYWKRGIGGIMMQEIEKTFSNASVYTLMTGNKSERNIMFYKKRGYVLYGEEKINNIISLVKMKKTNRL